MRIRKTAIALCLAVVSSGPLFAGELANIYQLALKNDPQLKAAEALFNADREIEKQNRAGLLPTLTLSADTTKTDSRFRDGTTNSYTLSLNQPIFDASAWFTFKQGKVLSEQAAVQFEAAQQNLIFRTIEAYLGTLRTKSALTTAQAQERAIKRRLDQVNAQFEVGLIANTDVQEAQASFDNARVARIDAEGELDNSYEALERLTAQPYAAVGLLAEAYPIEAPSPATSKPWVEKARSGNLNLRAADLASEAARRAAQAENANLYPTLNLAASHSDQDGNSGNTFGSSTGETNSIGLTLSFPIYGGGAIKSRTRALEQRLIEAQQNREDTLRGVTQATRSLLRDLRTGSLSVAALRQSIRSSEAALKATEEGFNVGTRNVVDVLQAEQQLYSAQLDYSNARFDFVQDLISLKQQLGTLSPEDIDQIDQWLE